MKLHFDPNQQYQLDAVKSIIDLFEGQPLNQGDFGFSISENGQLFNENGVGNRIVLSEEQILSNLQEVQKRNGFKNISEELDGMHFSVEMETGTGKWGHLFFNSQLFQRNVVQQDSGCNARSLQHSQSQRDLPRKKSDSSPGLLPSDQNNAGETLQLRHA